MKKTILKSTIFVSFLCFISNHVFAQTIKADDETSNQFEIQVIAKLGTAKFKETGNVSLNGFTNGSDVLISKKITKKTYLVTGLGYFEFNGNRTVSGNTSSVKNTYLHIPLQLMSNINLFKEKAENQNIFLTIGLGIYANTQLKQEVELLDGDISEKNLGWNFGFSSKIGIKFKTSDKLNLGIGFESQSDFNKMKKNNIERKIDGSNSIYFLLGFVL
ncbi:acyloxyacyl hydrolase [Flavobacterium sp. UBA7682]|uniref:acyloxyacyl hydrolase n=1 Tax=Flavobacterium sp. UBA7682 TaxID=1946560 RepID=UPI0025BF8FD3|nr:acyloxyacyl hydrolase [Flavobacterium sp. UBA7682]